MKQRIGRGRVDARQQVNSADPFLEGDARSFLQRDARLVARLVVNAPKAQQLEQARQDMARLQTPFLAAAAATASSVFRPGRPCSINGGNFFFTQNPIEILFEIYRV